MGHTLYGKISALGASGTEFLENATKITLEKSAAEGRFSTPVK
jgi:hypothetical protein